MVGMSDVLPLQPTDGGVLLRVKVVPGARRDRIAGLLGDRLKVQVAAAPEAGKANAAVCTLLAKALGVSRRAVMILAGRGQPNKTFKVTGLTVVEAAQRLHGLLPPCDDR